MNMAPKNKLANIMFMSENPFEKVDQAFLQKNQENIYRADDYRDKKIFDDKV